MSAETNPAQYAKLVERLPVTFRPFINEQLSRMDVLFAFERNVTETFLAFIAKLNPSDFKHLFRPVVIVEQKMGVAQWTFSRQGETLENTSLLAHSPYYQEWRQAVQGVFDAVSSQTQLSAEQTEARNGHRLILIVLPSTLPAQRERAWKEWGMQGRQLNLAASDSPGTSLSQALLGKGQASLLNLAVNSPACSAEDVWVLDADSAPAYAPQAKQPGRAPAVCLSYVELKAFRETFRDRLNWIHKDLGSADEVIASLRKMDVRPLCLDALKDKIATREFIKDLFLSGNGAVVFGNAFVQWAANEALRRARPKVLVARFDLRNKPKPFTSIAILEDQEHTSPVADAPDPEGSAIDAEILASYIWRSAARYEEYKNAVCLCIADAIPAVYAVGPVGHPLLRESAPLAVENLRTMISDWIA